MSYIINESESQDIYTIWVPYISNRKHFTKIIQILPKLLYFTLTLFSLRVLNSLFLISRSWMGPRNIKFHTADLGWPFSPISDAFVNIKYSPRWEQGSFYSLPTSEAPQGNSRAKLAEQRASTGHTWTVCTQDWVRLGGLHSGLEDLEDNSGLYANPAPSPTPHGMVWVHGVIQ